MNNRSDHTGSAVLLVGVSNPDTADQLVALSSILAAERPWEILLTHVVPIASQISLTTGRSSPEVVRARDFLQGVKERAGATGVNTRALVEVARNVHEGLVAATESQRADMILVGYSEDADEEDAPGDEDSFDRTMHRVARRSHLPMVVAKFRKAAMRRVLVPVTAEAPLETTGMLCRALAGQEETSLSFLHVVESEDSVEGATEGLAVLLSAKGLTSLGPLVVVASDSPVARIVEAAEHHDLVIVGPSGRPGFMSTLFSSSARRIAEEASASVLLVWKGRKTNEE